MSLRAVPLADLCEMDRRNVRPGDPLANELPFVGVENVTRDTGFLNFETNSRVGNGKSTAFRFDERHVLYSKLRPYLNKVAMPDFPGRCSTQLVPLLPRDGVDRDFLAHMLRRREVVKFAVASANGSRMPSVDMKLFMAMPTPFPPFDMQRQIADILNSASHIQRLRSRAYACLHNFAPALFVKMFGDPVENPMGWPETHLGAVCRMDRCGMQPNDPKSIRLPFVGMENVNSNTGALNFDTDSRIGSRKSVMFRFDQTHVLYGKLRPYLNKVATPEFVGICSTELVPLRPIDNVNRDFLAHFLRNKATVDFAVASATGARMPRTNMKLLMAMPVPLPPIELQQQFARIANRAKDVAVAAKTAASAASALADALAARLLEQAP